MKCGYAGTDFPAFTFPPLVGRVAGRPWEILVGHDAASKLTSKCDRVTHPIEYGIIRDCEEMCIVGDYTFGPEKVNVESPDCQILFVETDGIENSHRERMLKVMIEK